MSRDLLHYYERELAWLKQAGADFASAHPAIAASLRLEDGNIDDPHVARLIESVAFLNSRIQQQLDDNFPAITDALLEHLYPHFLAPLPSMTVVEMVAPEGLDRAVAIAARSTIDMRNASGMRCRFSTVYPVTLLPYELSAARLQSRPFMTPGADLARHAVAVLALQFDTRQQNFCLAQHGIDRLRLFIRAPSQYAWRLHQLLTCHCLHIAVAQGESDPAPVAIASHHLQMAGFGADENLLPVTTAMQPAYHYLTEFFHFPTKFLFIDLHGMAAASTDKPGSFTVFIYLDTSERELERNLNADSFSLTATPAVNLFSHRADPVQMLPHSIDYPLVPDIRALDVYEVYSVEKIERIDARTGDRREIPPFFGIAHDNRDADQFWHHRRQLVRRGHNHSEPGFDSFVAFSDHACSDINEKDAVMQATLLCSNRNLPARMATGSELPTFTLQQNTSGVRDIRALLPPSAAIRADLGNGARWRLLSQLNLNLSGLVDQADAAGALRNMLRVYDFTDSTTIHALINAIDNVQCVAAMAPLRCGRHSMLCRGVDICITFNDALLAGTSIALYANVLENFLAQSAGINSFVRLSAKLQGRPEVFKRWPARAGTRPLL